MTDWLRDLKRALRRDDAFFEQMHRQLAPAFTAAVGQPIDRFILIPPIEPAQNDSIPGGSNAGLVVRREANEELLDGDLLNVDFVSSVTIAWRQVGGGVQFSWRRLDAEDIRRWLADRRNIPIRTTSQIPIEIRDPVWPHVALTFEFASDASAETVAQAVQTVIESWDPADGAIHSAGPPREMDARNLLIGIDFGSAGTEALNRVLDAVAEAVPIKRVVLDS